MRRKTTWYKYAAKLYNSTGTYFEREVLKLSKLIWPDITQPPNSAFWDKNGVDLFVYSDNGIFPCVIQCKGFEVLELKGSQVQQVYNSVDSFIQSGYKCDLYLLVHNRDGRSQSFRNKVNSKLDELIELGIAKEAFLLDRKAFLDMLSDEIKVIIKESLIKHNNNLVMKYQNLFEFGTKHISTIPVLDSELSFKQGRVCDYISANATQSMNIADIFSTSTKHGWTLITGKAGAGKTTAALLATTLPGKSVIFIRCGSLSSKKLLTGTNVLIREFLNQLDLFENGDEDEENLFIELASPLVNNILSNSESGYILIIDGLDENITYSNLKGLQHLNNQLSDFRCTIILTTRMEHFSDLFGNFSSAFSELSSKSNKNARLLELCNWEVEHVFEFLESILSDNQSSAINSNIHDLVSLIEKNEHTEFYGDLLFNPLFLQFIVEDVAENGLRSMDRGSLIRGWVRRKIWRDREATERISIACDIDISEFSAKMIQLLENIASIMIQKTNSVFELMEYIDCKIIEKEAKKVFITQEATILSIMLNSVLLPISFREGINLNITFSFRTFHEYFLAAYIVRNNLPVEEYPEVIKTFYEDIISNAT